MTTLIKVCLFHSLISTHDAGRCPRQTAVSGPICFKYRSEASHHAVATSAGYMHKEGYKAPDDLTGFTRFSVYKIRLLVLFFPKSTEW